jgi:hypothetical protein
VGAALFFSSRARDRQLSERRHLPRAAGEHREAALPRVARADFARQLPVIGWLLLRGRCRFCRTRISARYPLVELAAGVVFTALCLGEAVFEGATLPLSARMAEQTPLFGMAVYHFALFCGLGAAALMAYDGAVIPPRFKRVVLLIGLVPPLLWPDLRPVHFAISAGSYGRLAIGLADGALGGLLGRAAWGRIVAHRHDSAPVLAAGTSTRRGAGVRRGALAGRPRRPSVLRSPPSGVRVVATPRRRPGALARRAVLRDARLRAGLEAAHLAVVCRKVVVARACRSPWFAVAAVVGTFVVSLAARPLLLREAIVATRVPDRRVPHRPQFARRTRTNHAQYHVPRAAETVTGSKYLLETEDGVQHDCGLFRVSKMRLRNWQDLPFAEQSVNAVVLTHAHTHRPHRVPAAARKSLRGPIYARPPRPNSWRSCFFDSAGNQESDAEYANRKGFSSTTGVAALRCKTWPIR